MVVELRELLHESSSPPHVSGDMTAVVQAGRRRVRVRRAKVFGGTAPAAVIFSALAISGAGPTDREADTPEGPVLRLSDARRAVEGQDYRVLGVGELIR